MDNIAQINSTKQLLHDSDFFYTISLGLDGVYDYVNTNYNNKFSFIDGSLLGMTVYKTVHPDDFAAMEETGIKCADNPGKFFPLMLHKSNGAGGYVKTQWECALIIDNDVPTGMFCIGYDITEVEKALSQVQLTNKNLEIQNEKLREIAFEQSHNVRAPLANIMGLVNILKTFELGPNTKSVIEMLEDSSKQLDITIKNIVDKIYS